MTHRSLVLLTKNDSVQAHFKNVPDRLLKYIESRVVKRRHSTLLWASWSALDIRDIRTRVLVLALVLKKRDLARALVWPASCSFRNDPGMISAFCKKFEISCTTK